MFNRWLVFIEELQNIKQNPLSPIHLGYLGCILLGLDCLDLVSN